MSKKIMAMLLVIVMLLGLLPMGALAAEPNDDQPIAENVSDPVVTQAEEMGQRNRPRILTGAGGTSDSAIVFDLTGVTSGYKEKYTGNLTVGSETVSTTYVLSFAEDSFTMTNNTGKIVSGQDNTANTDNMRGGMFPYNSQQPTTATMFAMSGDQMTKSSAEISAWSNFSFTESSALTGMGYPSEKINSSATKYYFMYFKHAGISTLAEEYRPAMGYAVLIEIAPSSGGTTLIDKAALNAAIAQVTGDNVANWYQTNDRYNGKNTSVSGFWADMQSALTAAQTVAANGNATQAQVDTAAANLTAAIAKLIPTTRVNATELYEAVQSCEIGLVWRNCTDQNDSRNLSFIAIPSASDLTPVTEETATEESWSAYQSALAAAQAELAKLYDTSGESTEYNASANAAAVAAAAEALDSAVYALEYISGFDDAKMAYDSLNTLMDKVFDPAKMTQTDYTPESWASFKAARTAAQSFLSGHTAPTAKIGQRQSKAYVQAYSAFWDACYEGLVSSKTGNHVTIYITDSYAMSKGVAPLETTGMYEVELAAENTLGEALKGILHVDYVTLPEDGSIGTTVDGALTHQDPSNVVGVYVNGVYAFNMSVNSSGGTVGSYGYYNIRLHDGDTVVVSSMLQPVYSNMSGGATTYPAGELAGDVRYLEAQSDGSITTDVAATAGTSFGLKAMYSLAMPNGFNGARVGLSGISIYVSEPCATREEALRAKLTTDTGVVTGENGTFDMTLYSAPGTGEGWHVLGMLSRTEKGGLSNGPTILVHVTDPKDISQIRTSLQTALDEIYQAYGRSFYTEEQYSSIEKLYQAAVADIAAATYSGTAYAAYTTAADQIGNIQQENNAAMARNLKSVRTVLEALLVAGDKVYSGEWCMLEDLFKADTGLYTCMTPYQRTQFTQMESAKLKLLEDVYKAGKDALLTSPAHTVTVELYDAETGEALDYGQVCDNTNQTASIYFYEGFSYINNEWGESFYFKAPSSVSSTKISSYGKTLTISTDTAANIANYMYNVNADWRLNSSSGYEIERVECAALEDSVRTWRSTSAAGAGDDVASFNAYTLHDDITVKLYLRRLESAAVTSALAELKTAYDNYVRANYSAENWNVLVQAYKDGVIAVRAADDDAARRTAVETAKTKMAAVPAKAVASNGIPGWGSDDAFDAGAQIGTVTVTVENTTFPGGDFTGSIVREVNYPLGKNDTMMTVILRALKDNGFSWTGTGGSDPSGYGITYLATISKGGKSLGEFSGEPGSGWMGTLNDFFTNEGFEGFSARDGKIMNGDIIGVMFTQNLGEDIGGSWGNSDTTLKSLNVSTGTITPAFTSGAAGKTHEYALVISGNSTTVTVTPSANNKNYMVKAFLNEKVTSNDEGNSHYRRSEAIPVTVGDTIYVGVGENAWPSMNKQGAESRSYEPTWYELHVISRNNGADYAQQVISSLPAASRIKYSNYAEYAPAVEYARTIYSTISASEQAKVNISKLTDAEAAVKKFKEIDNVKELLTAIPDASKLTTSDKSKVQAAKAAYDKLTDEQKQYITVGDVAKYNAAVEWLEKQGVSTGGQITGSDKAPEDVVKPTEGTTVEVTPEATVTNGEAKAEVDNKTVSAALTEAAKDDTTTAIVIAPEVKGEADKVTVELPKTAVSNVANNSDLAVTVSSDVAEITVTNEGLTELVKETGSTVTLTAENVKDESGKATGEVKIEVAVGDKVIDEVAGGLNIAIPADEDDNGNVMVLVDEDGNETVIKKSVVDEDTAKAIVDGSCTVKVVDNSKDFVDVKDSAWYAGDVDFASSHELFQGVSETQFAPEANMTRAMLATVLFRLEDAAANGTSVFADVPADTWYTDAVVWANGAGIVQGYGSSFGSNDNILRQDLATMLYRYAKTIGMDTTVRGDVKDFKDTDNVADYANDAMRWAVGMGIINGKPGGILDPRGNASRAEVAAMLQRLVKIMVK